MKIKVLAHPTEKQLTKKILKLKKKYPEGTHWGDGIGKYGKLVCEDFANMVCKSLYRGNYRLYGVDHPYDVFNNNEVLNAFYYDFDTKITKKMRNRLINKCFNMIEAGDQLYSVGHNHTMIVVKKSGNKITLAEGNYFGKVHWGRVMTKDEFIKGEWEVVKYHRYKWKYVFRFVNGKVKLYK